MKRSCSRRRVIFWSSAIPRRSIASVASRGDAVEVREVREPGDLDAVAYAEGAALPNPGAKLAGPSFEDWLAAA